MIVPTFDECERIWATVMVCVPRSTASWITRSPTWIEPFSLNGVDGLTSPDSSTRHRDHLERRAGLVRVGDGAVAQALLIPAGDDQVVVGVEARLHGEREDAAGLDVHHDGGRAFAAQFVRVRLRIFSTCRWSEWSSVR